MKIEAIFKSNTITLARVLLALCFLTTLIFTPIHDLFPIQHFTQLKSDIHGLSNLNLFLWFDSAMIPYFISLFVLILVVTGIYPRIMCLIQSWVSYSIYHTMLVTDGGDQINIILTFLLIPICVLDSRNNGWKVNINRDLTLNTLLSHNASLALIFIQIQMAILYLNAGVSKLFATDWLNGTAVYYWFNDPTFGAPAFLHTCFSFLFQNDYSVTIINWSVILLELFLFVGLFLQQKYKYLLFVLAFVFHFLIFAIHGLPSFGLSMTAGLILFYFQLDKTVQENLKLIKINLLKIITDDK